MNKQEKLSKIYEVVSDKSLDYGCKVKVRFRDLGHFERGGDVYEEHFDNEVICIYLGDDYILYDGYISKLKDFGEDNNAEIIEVIGHNVMYGDISFYIEKLLSEYKQIEKENWLIGWAKQTKLLTIQSEIIVNWEDKTKPIDLQSEECIDYIFNLVVGKN